MLRDKCRTCGGSDLYQGRMIAQGGVAIGRAFRNWGWTNVARCAVCVTCGGIEPYLDDAGIAKIREWKATESHASPATQGDDNTGSQVRLLRILIAVVLLGGILTYVLLQMMNVADKLK